MNDGTDRSLYERVTSLERAVSADRVLIEQQQEQLARVSRAEEILRRAGEGSTAPMPAVRPSHARPGRDRHGLHIVPGFVVAGLAWTWHVVTAHKAGAAVGAAAAAALVAGVQPVTWSLPVYTVPPAVVTDHRPRPAHPAARPVACGGPPSITRAQDVNGAAPAPSPSRAADLPVPRAVAVLPPPVPTPDVTPPVPVPTVTDPPLPGTGG